MKRILKPLIQITWVAIVFPIIMVLALSLLTVIMLALTVGALNKTVDGYLMCLAIILVALIVMILEIE